MASEQNWELMREWAHKIKNRKRGRPFDAAKDLPREWYESLIKQGLDPGSDLSSSEQAAIRDGRAHKDKDGYVIYDYEKQLAYDEARRREASVDQAKEKSWEQIIGEAPDS